MPGLREVAVAIETTLRSRARPDGPLAVTHLRRGADRRYDASHASPDLDIDSVTHDRHGAREAGSDHAAVVATLTFRAAG